MLRAKKGFLLRRLGTDYTVVAIGEASKCFNGMIRINGTGAFYWKELEQGTTEEALVDKTLECFPGVNRETVRQDVHEFLQTISAAIEYDPAND